MDFFEGGKYAERRDTTPTGGPVTPAAAGTVTAYALAALRGEVDNLQRVPIGEGRNDQLNRSAVKMYGLAAAGEIDERTVTETLGAADGGLDYTATRRTLQSARDAVYTRLGARTVPESTTRERIPPWASDDPLDPNFDERLAQRATSTRGDTSRSQAARDGDSHTATAAAPSSSPSDPDAAYRLSVQLEARRVRLTRDARRLVDEQDAERDFRVPPYLATLTDELALPDEPVTYSIDELIPTGANVVLTAQYKTGKTTTINNLARSYADGVPFLDRFTVNPLDGRVALFNYEVDGRQYRRWLREVGIVNTDAVSVLNLRGYRLPLNVPHVEDWIVQYLRDRDAAVWILDPMARAAVGVDENDNGAMGVWLDTLDVIKERAGVDVLVMPNHTGRGEAEPGGERSRGATRVDDWADVRWLLTKDDGGVRYFRATGRDVEIDEGALVFDESTRHLRITGGDRRTNAAKRLDEAIETCIRNAPGITTSDLRVGVKSIVGSFGVDAYTAALARLTAARRVHQIRVGNRVEHRPGPSPHPTNVDPLDDP